MPHPFDYFNFISSDNVNLINEFVLCEEFRFHEALSLMSSTSPYGKHGKWARWRVIKLYFDFAWSATEVHGHLNSGGEVVYSHHYTQLLEKMSIFTGANYKKSWF